MKAATIPAMRVKPKLREAAQSVLASGETLSSFVEESLRANIERRLYNQAFIARGLASRDDAIATKEYYSAENVLGELADMQKTAGAIGKYTIGFCHRSCTPVQCRHPQSCCNRQWSCLWRLLIRYAN